jgi:hypothetical protein
MLGNDTLSLLSFRVWMDVIHSSLFDLIERFIQIMVIVTNSDRSSQDSTSSSSHQTFLGKPIREHSFVLHPAGLTINIQQFDDWDLGRTRLLPEFMMFGSLVRLARNLEPCVAH